MISRIFRLNLNNIEDRNVWNLVLEIFWASILGAVATFNSAYAVRLGASSFEVGLLSSIPALVAVLVSIPAGRFLQTKARPTPWVMNSLLIHRSGFLLVALAPFLTFFNVPPGFMVVLILILISPPAHFFNVGFFPLLSAVVPEKRRAALFSARSITGNAVLSLTVFLCGQWLSRVEFPINYQVIYFIGFLTGMVSNYFLARIQVPDSVPVPHETNQKLSPIKAIHNLWLSVRAQPQFFRFNVNTFLHALGLWAVNPLYVVYYVRTLGAKDDWLGMQGMLTYLAVIVGNALWRGVISRWGEQRTLKMTIVCAGLYPLLVGLMPRFTSTLFADQIAPLTLILGVVGFNGLISAGINLSHVSIFLKVTPDENRPYYTGVYMTAMNIGASIAPLVGVAVSRWIGVETTLIICGLLSIIGSASFIFSPVTGKEH